MQRLPLLAPSSTLPSASTSCGWQPKNGNVAEPGLSFVAPGNGVISNDLLGHSGIITHDVEQTVTPDQYSGLKVIGISANVVDNDAPGVILLQSVLGDLTLERWRDICQK